MTLSSIKHLHSALAKIIEAQTGAFRQKIRGNSSWYSGTTSWYSPRPNQKGKCRREHRFMATFVPLNRQLGKFIQQQTHAPQHDFDVTASRFKDAAAKLVLALFREYIEAPGHLPHADIAELPVTSAMLEANGEIQAVYGADFLERLHGTTLGALRASFAAQEVEHRVVQETAQNRKALILENILVRAEGFLSQTEQSLLTEAVRRSYTEGQHAFLKLR